MVEERDILRKEILSQKKPGLDDLGNSQTIQIARDTKIRRFTVIKAFSGEKSRGMAGESFISIKEIILQVRIFAAIWKLKSFFFPYFTIFQKTIQNNMW